MTFTERYKQNVKTALQLKERIISDDFVLNGKKLKCHEVFDEISELISSLPFGTDDFTRITMNDLPRRVSHGSQSNYSYETWEKSTRFDFHYKIELYKKFMIDIERNYNSMQHFMVYNINLHTINCKTMETTSQNNMSLFDLYNIFILKEKIKEYQLFE